MVHEGGFSVERVGKRQVRFRRPDGRLIPEASLLRRTGCDSIEARNRALGISVDGDTCRPLSAGEHLDYDHAVMVMCAAASAHGPPPQG